MPHSVSSESSATSPSSTRKRLFTRAHNPLSSTGKPGPLLDANPPPVVRPSHRETRKSRVRSIKTKIQAARTPLKLLRRLSNPNGHRPHITRDDILQQSRIDANQERGRSHSLQLDRPQSTARSHSAPGAPSISQSSTSSSTLSMSDSVSLTSATESNATTLPQDVSVPIDLQTGVTMNKVSAKGSKKVTVRIDADLGQIFYQSRRARISKFLPPLHTFLCRRSSGDLLSPLISRSSVITLIG